MPFAVQFGTSPIQNAALMTALPVSAALIVTGANLVLYTLDSSSYTGYVLTRIVMRTLAAVTGFAAAPPVSIGWTTGFSTAVLSGTAPLAALSATVMLPPSSTAIPYGQPGQPLILKPTAAITGPGVGTYFDIYGYQIP